MKLTTGFQQSLIMVLLVATQEAEQGLTINVISKQMKIKASYLRKIARKLVESGLLSSSKSRFSGYKLQKSIHEMTLLDIFNAIEGKESFVEETNVATNTFEDIEEAHVKEKLYEVSTLLDEAENLYRQKLASLTLADLLPKLENGTFHRIDWRERK